MPPQPEPARSAASGQEKIIRDSYTQFASRRVVASERRAMLMAKLREEVAEVEACRWTDEEFVGELADVVEVCFALGGYEAVEDARNAKLEDRGGFTLGLVMRLDERTADGHGRPL